MIKEPPFTQPMVNKQGMITLAWMDYFRFWEDINNKIDVLSDFTPGNLVRANSDGGITDAGSGFAISKFTAYDATGEISIGIGSWTDIDWDTETVKDSDFWHDADTPGTEIRCDFNGTVEITLYGTLYVDTHVNSTLVECKAQKDSGDDYEDIPGLLAGMTFSAASQRLNFTVMQTVSITNGDNIKAMMSATSGGSTIKTVANACGIKIERKS